MLIRAKQAKARAEEYLSAAGRPLSTMWIILLALGSAAIFLFLMNMEIGIYDEALVLQGAVEVGAGKVPHRDFFWVYGPMQLWVISALFSTFGKAILVARLYDVAIRAAIVFLFGLAARRMGLRSSLVVGVMLIETAVISASRFFLYPVFPSILCALAGTLLLVGDGAKADIRPGRLVGAGMLTGITALFRYDIGFFLLAAHILALCLFAVDARASLRPLIRQVLLYGIGVSIVFLPVAVGAWAVGAIPGFVHDIISFPPGNYARMRALPWPAPSLSLGALPSQLVYVPFLTAALGLYWLILNKKNGRRIESGAKLAVVFLLIILLFSLKGVVRVSFIHAVLALMPALVFLVWLISRNPGTRLQMLSLAVFGFASLLIGANALLLLRVEAQRGFAMLLPSRILGSPAEAAGTTVCATPPELRLGIVDRDTSDALCYIGSHTRPGEPIFVGAGRHDKLFINNVAIYYLSNRRPATHWYHLEPGLQTTLEIQKTIVKDLVRNDVRLIALDSEYDDVEEPNESAKSSDVCLLDRFVASRYREVARFGSIAILTRRETGFVPDKLPISCRVPTAGGRLDNVTEAP